MLDAPVAMFVYRRPELTRRVLECVRKVEPRLLLVVADAPRDESERIRCAEARALFDEVGWSCQVLFHFADRHMGCAARVASGLDWVFATVDRAIVLEDDILAEPGFFWFCDEMLRRYEHEPRVMQIAGTNLAGSLDAPYAYGFSKFCIPPWGWASWARAWRHYDFRLTSWDAHRQSLGDWLGPTCPMWVELVDGYKPALQSWDLQWNVALWCQRALSVMPSRNLIANIGYGEHATFTRFERSRFRELPIAALESPLRAPPSLDPLVDAELEPVLMDFVREILLAGRMPQEMARRA